MSLYLLFRTIVLSSPLKRSIYILLSFIAIYLLISISLVSLELLDIV